MTNAHSELVIGVYALIFVAVIVLGYTLRISNNKNRRKAAQILEARRAAEKLPGQFRYIKENLNKRIAALTPDEQTTILLPIRDAELHVAVAASRRDQQGWEDAHRTGIDAARAAISSLLAKTNGAKTNGAA